MEESIQTQKVINELMENGGSVGNAIRKAGYSPVTAKNPKKITSSKKFQKAVKPILESLDEERQKIIERLKVTRSKAKYRDLIDGLDKITKNHQLLSGGATENVKVSGVEISVRK